ncbi:lytic murein transglycosylase [Microbacterium sp. HD4P20]|uniref:lytic transglycosylase domain-containing protein n=1 Tax=Microbacterium sp. HD4P20 TaxID=2864874 RepID=UPI0020A2FE3F|nr:lytic murein transglycosylase [Microbacterium sp. HD4P20]MCP2636513.1 lytic murein transglycosylase [Microbacterium sp. HD4P20]
MTGRIDKFDDLVDAGDGERPAEPTSPRRFPWAWAMTTIVLAVVGAGTIGAAIWSADTADSATAASTPTTTPSSTIRAVDPPSPSPRSTDAATARPDERWVERVARDAGIPERALLAYAGAVLAVAETHPGCGLGWNTLAGIGLVESEHGTINGSSISPDGVAQPWIIGIPLDGNGTEAIRDTDGGRLDTDSTWDRAVGPMQFIPETWAAYRQDGNGDGETDIHQIDDAALGAAVYLCEVGGDMTAPDRWIAAISAYNPSVEYNNRVAAAAEQYATVP